MIQISHGDTTPLIIGVLSRELAQHTQQIVGLDISEKMVDEYNKRVEQQGILAEEMQALRGDLQDPPPELTDKTFHVVVVRRILDKVCIRI